MTYLDYLEKKVLLERLVIGLEEPVLVKGLGELQAKIDSGNGGYNVIHGTDFHQQGDVLMFTTHDSFGHEKKISAKIIDDIEVNMGGGNIEKRPVIELDIKFAGEDYKKIPFSVSDRSSNTHPILVSKGFVENELEALIDVGAKNISNDGVDVVYGESWLKGGDNVSITNPIKKVATAPFKAIGAVGRGIKDGVKGLYGMGKTLTQDGANLVKGAYNAGKTVTQDTFNAGKAVASAGANTAQFIKDFRDKDGYPIQKPKTEEIKATTEVAQKIKKGANLIMDDIKALRSKMASYSDWIKFLKESNAVSGTILEKEESINPKITPIIPILGFSCQKGIIKDDKNKGGNIQGLEKLPKYVSKGKIYVSGQQGRAESWKKEISIARQGIQSLKNQRINNEQSTEEQEEFILEEAYRILSEDNGADTQQQQTNTEIPQDQQATEGLENLDEMITEFNDLSLFQIWFIPISTKEDAIERVCDFFIKGNKCDNIWGSLYDSGKVTFDKIGQVIEKVVKTIQGKEQRQLLSGIFCASISPDMNKADKRDYKFYQSQKQLIYFGVTKDEIKILQTVIANYFPHLENSINVVVKNATQEKEKLIDEIINKNGYENELKNPKAFPKFSEIINQIKKQYNSFRQSNQPNELAIKNTAQFLNNPNNLIVPFIQEFTYNTLKGDKLGVEILKALDASNGISVELKNMDDVNKWLFHNEEVQKLLLNTDIAKKITKAQEDEEWIELKLKQITRR